MPLSYSVNNLSNHSIQFNDNNIPLVKKIKLIVYYDYEIGESFHSHFPSSLLYNSINGRCNSSLMRFLSFKSLNISRPNASWSIWKLKSEPFSDGIEDIVIVVVVAAAFVVGNDEYDWDDNGDDAAIPPP